MGYVTKDIAVIEEPTILSVSYASNFVQFASKASEKTYLDLNLWVTATPSTPDLVNRTLLVMVGGDGITRTFSGTTDVEAVGGNIFYVSTDITETLENLRVAMLRDAWIAANFALAIPMVYTGGDPANGFIMNIRALGAGDAYEFTLTAPNDISDSAYIFNWNQETTTNDDSISGEAETAIIALDVYVNPKVEFGEPDLPDDTIRIGTYLTTLIKTYYTGEKLWFELNGMFNSGLPFNRPVFGMYGWFNTGTAFKCRFAARFVGDVRNYTFYQSNTLFIVRGYGRPSEVPDMENYYLQSSGVTLLTNKPRTPYLYGQREYLNFIFQNGVELDDPSGESLRVAYQAYNTANELIGIAYDHEIEKAELWTINTCALDIGPVIDAYPNVGIIRVALAEGEEIISNELEYLVRPVCLHESTPFTFLNSLGGWDTFNFDAKISSEVKPNIDTFDKTLTPGFAKGESLETIYLNKLDTPVTVEGAPVSNEVAAWLSEFAAAKVVLDPEGNYIIIEEFTLKQTEDNSNFHTPSFRYRLTEVYE